MRKVFLDDLPKWEGGTYKGKINWKECTGKRVEFIYDEIEGEIQIVEYFRKNNRSFIKIKYLNKCIFNISVGGFSKCSLGELLGTFTRKYRYKVGDIIKDVNSGILKIIDEIKIYDDEKGYKYKCLICDSVKEISEYTLIKKHGCSVCSNQDVKVGFNDIHTTVPWLGKLLANQEDGYRYTKFSNNKVLFKCNNCGEEKEKKIYVVYRKGFSCSKCGDGVSYPNKFMFNVLSQLAVKFNTEYTPEWSNFKDCDCGNEKTKGKKRYDFYIPSKNTIVEMHGVQHYEDVKWSSTELSNRNLKEEQKNDEIKFKLAKKNGINKYIVIDARNSDMNFIKSNILNSELSSLFDLNNVDWLECHKFALSSRVKETCDIWNWLNVDERSVMKIVDIMGMSEETIRKYLKRGRDLGWCDYEEYHGMRVVQLSLDNILVEEYESGHLASKKTGTRQSGISLCCKGKQKTAGGFKWMFKDDYEIPERRKTLLEITERKTIDPRKGRNLSQEHKEKIRIGLIDKRHMLGKLGSENPNSKKVAQIDIKTQRLIAEFGSIKEVERKLGYDASGIVKVCKGKSKSAYGYIWKYAI